jgi:hypothetical protein
MNQSMFHRLCAFLFLIVTIVLAVPALAADKESAHFGDSSGTPFISSCNGGAVVGFAYYWDTYNLSGVTAACRNLDAKGLPTGPVTTSKSAGVSTKYAGNIGCSSGYLNRILVGLTNAQTIQYIEPQCFDVTRGPSQTKPKATSYNGIRGKDSDAFCGSYETYAYAIVGTYSKDGPNPGINSIGLKCRTLDAAVDTGDNNGDGGGEQATTNVDTTVYVVKGQESPRNKYLNAGDQVTIVTCQSDNWCKISSPHSGWVWGDDLNFG